MSASQIIIVGGGLAGLSAAHTVIENGGKALVIEKNAFCGGNSTKATSGINGALTRAQIQQKISDSIEAFEKDTAKSAALGDPKFKTYDLAKVLTEESAPAVEWLVQRFGLDLSLISRLGGHSYPRTHRGKEKFPGMTITYALMEKFEEIEKQTKSQQAKLITKARVTKLIKDVDSVIGVEYEKDGKNFKEFGPVIIATGGYGADFSEGSLLNKYRPDLIGFSTTNGDHCTGDGVKMAEEIGASLVDMEYVQVHPTGLVNPKDPQAKVKFLAAEALRGVGGLMLNKNGDRFCDELGRRDYVSKLMRQHEHQGPFRLVLNKAGSSEIEWHCKHYVGRGLMKKFNSGADLATEMGISTQKLEQTFEQYNTNAKEGKDDFGKKFFHNLPFSVNDEFHVSIVCPVVHYCMGGVKISPGSEVMNRDAIIPGLYATGEVCGGVHGKNRLGGNSLLDCVVFGRVSGRNASKYLFSNILNAITSMKMQGQMAISPSGERLLKITDQLIVPQPEITSETKSTSLPYQEKWKAEQLIEQLVPSNTHSRNSGGTTEFLPQERAKATFNVQELIHILDGGKEATKRKQFIRSPIKNADYSNRYDMSRSELMADHLNEFIRIHKQFANFKATRQDVRFMTELASNGGSAGYNHIFLFCGTIAGQGTQQQFDWWWKKAMSFQIVGCYAQTELGHGSNVRGLQTTARYDKATQEFILDTPTLGSRKWWPGTLGKISTHAVVYAQLIIDDKEYGVHVFMLQIRDENHKPLPGIELGDLGTKIGDGANDTGFMVLNQVRIPREFMLAKYSQVQPDGTYAEQKVDRQIHYTTMMTTRASMVATAAARLAQASTISIRWSCVRRQGFLNTAKGVSHLSEERQIIDYQIQQYRLFKQLSIAFALKFVQNWMLEQIDQMEGGQVGQIKNPQSLKTLAPVSSGLKALSTRLAVDGIEDCRKCCGGNGYLNHSGIAHMGSDYLWQVTAEGDQIILTLLTARFLYKACEAVLKTGKKQTGLLEYLNQAANPQFEIKKIAPQQASSSVQFTNLEYLNKLFEFRALIKVYQATKLMEDCLKKKKMRFDEAWNSNALDLMKASNAHVHYIMFNCFYKKIQSIQDGDIAEIMTAVCGLYGNSNILDDDGWGGILHSSQFSLAKQAAYQLMAKIRPNCVALVDAFDIPDNVLSSSIGKYDGNVYESLFNAARKSTLNQTDPFPGYETVLRPHLNREFLRRGNVIPVTSKL